MVKVENNWRRKNKGSRKKSIFFSGQSTEAFRPLPPGLLDKRTFFRLEIAGNGFWQFFFSTIFGLKEHVKDWVFPPTTNTLYTNIDIWICRLKQNIFKLSTATNLKLITKKTSKSSFFLSGQPLTSPLLVDCSIEKEILLRLP